MKPQFKLKTVADIRSNDNIITIHATCAGAALSGIGLSNVQAPSNLTPPFPGYRLASTPAHNFQSPMCQTPRTKKKTQQKNNHKNQTINPTHKNKPNTHTQKNHCCCCHLGYRRKGKATSLCKDCELSTPQREIWIRIRHCTENT